MTSTCQSGSAVYTLVYELENEQGPFCRMSVSSEETVLMGGCETKAFQRPGSQGDGNQRLEDVSPPYLGFPTAGD